MPIKLNMTMEVDDRVNGFVMPRHGGGLQSIEQTGKGAGAPGFQAVNGVTPIDMVDVAQPGFMFMQNTSPTETVVFGLDTGAVELPVGYLRPGEKSLFRAVPGASYVLWSLGTTAKVIILIAED